MSILPTTPPIMPVYGTTFRVCTRAQSEGDLDIGGLLGMVKSDPDCRPIECECIHVYFDPDQDGWYENDENAFLFEKSGGSASNFTLSKFDGTSWISLSIVNTSFAEVFPTGTWTAYPNRFGFRIKWRNVGITYGVGTYRVSTVSGDSFIRTPCFNLQVFDCHIVSNTAVVEVYTNSLVSNLRYNYVEGQNPLIDYREMGSGWYDRNRYIANIGQAKPSVEENLEIRKFTYTTQAYYQRVQESYTFNVNVCSEGTFRRLVAAMSQSVVQVTDYYYYRKLEEMQQYYKRLHVLLSAAPSPNYADGLTVYNTPIEIKKRTDFYKLR